ncbi:ribonucleoside-diphosphate reductase subunit alpha [Metabacillus sp. Hm71]|uniref:ribonucleoside-diphosphate reductase subunit alpha n=1 Tax=Metabacillus sp. Hm71 TaxID=3450743 RepID=UPI003F43C901
MTIITKDRETYIQRKEFDEERFHKFVLDLYEDTKDKDKIPVDQIEEIYENVKSFVLAKKEVEAERLFDFIIRESNGKISERSPQFTHFSAAVLRRKMYKQASKKRGFDYHKGYGDYYSLVKKMTEEGRYDTSLLKKYSQKELEKFGKLIDMSKDKLFDYSGLLMLSNTYLVKNGKTVLELPQERFLTASVYLMQNEPKTKRYEYIKQAYHALSNHYIGLATPTLKNAGSPHGTLSSCHIVTIDDDLKSIFNAGTQMARFSQNGAGLGTFLGFIRADGSWIRGKKGNATGIKHPSRLQSIIAEYVNQGGVRKGGIAAYLPLWHGDIYDFLELRLKTGSQEKRAHSIKTAVCVPDEFMRRLKNKELWTLFDPYELKKKLNIDLNKLYDKKKLKENEEPNEVDHAFTYFYRIAEQSTELELRKTVKATDIYKSIYVSRITSGTPYMYWSDTAARLNPNGHAGMPYGSNLCSEIVQNMEYDVEESEVLEETGRVVTVTKGEGLVSCNLSSIVAHNVNDLTEEEYQEVVNIQFRMLDNVISLNRTVVPQATHTNNLYRAVGAGLLGFVTLLTNKGVMWESDESANFAEEVFKRYLKAQIKASHELAMEKGSYPLFEGSDWQTGEFFDKRGLVSDEWLEYREMANKGMRNSYLGAIAPTASNSTIMNGSPSIDPLYDVIYKEEKSGISTIIVPPNYNNQTKWFYKSGFEMDEMWAINVVAAAQKYVDQGISHNYHISQNTKGSELLRLDMGAWEKGLKTIYYTHTANREKPEDCIYCQ